MASTTLQKGELSFKWHTSILDIDESAWDRLADPLPTPILEWEWLRQLEISGSTIPATGWIPSHLTVWAKGEMVAAAPLYIKSHSAGEYVYDYAWADVAKQLGIRYYPKLVGMSPATPSVGYRFLIRSDLDEEQVTCEMLEEIDGFCKKRKLSNVGFNFVDPDWAQVLLRNGYNKWLHQSYEWKNKDYSTFDDYLAVFNKNQRRNIRRERRSADEQGLVVKAYQGDEIPDSYFPLMYRFYDITNSQYGPWAARFLTKEFFLGLAERFRHRLLFMAAYLEGREDSPIAMSFLITKGDQLIGRFWGTTAHYDNLHFNTCYYGPIEWAIEHGVKAFDPGAGSPHKLRRGFEA
ncbi:MAG TPA: GNAT family N-acetyltransferase, partial [Spirochaetia bacterium]|nr:GNAT family N-acetyltransferase [Spirochaetia bacterium]